MNDFYDSGGKVVSITPKIIDQLKRLKASRKDDSSYCPDGVMLQWSYSDNQDVCKSEDEFKMLYMPLQFICMLGDLTSEFKNKHNVEYHHEALLRRLFLDLENDDGLIITTGFKRPFGNSNVEGDVAEEMKVTYLLDNTKNYFPYKKILGEDDEACENILSSFVADEYLRFLTILEAYVKEFEMEYRVFEGSPRRRIEDKSFDWSKYVQPKFGRHTLHSYMENWKLAKSELRDEKIKDLIN